ILSHPARGLGGHGPGAGVQFSLLTILVRRGLAQLAPPPIRARLLPLARRRAPIRRRLPGRRLHDRGEAAGPARLIPRLAPEGVFVVSWLWDKNLKCLCASVIWIRL